MTIELTQQNYQTEILDSNIPAVIKFYDTTCESCKFLSPILEKISKDYDGKVKFTNCNRLENSEVARKYGVQYAAQLDVVYKDKRLGNIIPGARMAAGGAHLAAREEFIKEKIGQCLEALVLK